MLTSRWRPRWLRLRSFGGTWEFGRSREDAVPPGFLFWDFSPMRYQYLVSRDTPLARLARWVWRRWRRAHDAVYGTLNRLEMSGYLWAPDGAVMRLSDLRTLSVWPATVRERRQHGLAGGPLPAAYRCDGCGWDITRESFWSIGGAWECQLCHAYRECGLAREAFRIAIRRLFPPPSTGAHITRRAA